MRLPCFLHPTYLFPCLSFTFSPFTFTPLTPLTHHCLTLPPPFTLTFLLSFTTIFLLPLVMTKEWMKVHTNGRVRHEASTGIDGDYFYFKEGSTGIIKILEPMNPQLNYYEYLIVNRGQEASIGIGVCMQLALPQALIHSTLVGIVIM